MIHHVAVETPRARVREQIAFYALLGFEEVPAPETLQGVAEWVQRDGQQVHLLYADDPVVAPRGHFAVVCPDYEATVARLESAGFPFERHTVHWGSPRGYVHDPVGHRIEVMEFPPG
jgi:catechol 2,3-dioxygenase-like lactoylglutathione lyase family enzyme